MYILYTIVLSYLSHAFCNKLCTTSGIHLSVLKNQQNLIFNRT